MADGILSSPWRCAVPATLKERSRSVSDFGKGIVWKPPEPVLVSFGRHRETHTMKVMQEYLGFDGDEARPAIAELVQSTGSLSFSGPRGLSVSFDLAEAQGALAQFKKHCGI